MERAHQSLARLLHKPGNLKRFILPALGRLAVPEITRADVAKFHNRAVARQARIARSRI